MSLAYKRIKVYTKMTLFVIVAVAVGAVLIKNRQHTVNVWFFGLVDSTEAVNVVWLMLCTAAGSVITWQVLLTTLSLIKDTRELRRERAVQDRERTQEDLAAKLDEQERRIDEKVRKSLSREADANGP